MLNPGDLLRIGTFCIVVACKALGPDSLNFERYKVIVFQDDRLHTLIINEMLEGMTWSRV